MQFTAPSRELKVANREQGQVEKIKANGELSIRLDSGRTVDFDLKKHPHLDHGYAVTSHSGQGLTADRVLVHVETQQGEQLVNNRLAYVAVSRARYDAQLYTNDKTGVARELGRDVSHATALSAVAPKAAQAPSVTVPAPAPVSIAKAVGGKIIEHIKSAEREIDHGRGISD